MILSGMMISYFLPSLLVTALVSNKSTCTRSSSSTILRSTLKLDTRNIFSQITEADLKQLASNGYVVTKQFLNPDFVQLLRKDIDLLRRKGRFSAAKIGQDSTNALNTNIRVAETVFIGESKLKDIPSEARYQLYQVLDSLRLTLSQNPLLKDDNLDVSPPLDRTLSEFLFAYYPKGGFYRRHMDAVPNSVSALREYSILIYLNDNWNELDGGYLRIHLDSGRDFLPSNENPSYIDVKPEGGTLVLFKSDRIPHEVLDTNAERAVVVGWYNRPFTAADVSHVASEKDKVRAFFLLIAVALVSSGIFSLVL
jgi:SM-20-related protein